jgi:hypothetical protein
MNKNYQKPALDVEKFEVEDVITASGTGELDDHEGLSVVVDVDFN